MKRCVLSRHHLVQLLLQPDFYTSCPEFVYLQPRVVAAGNPALPNATRRCCGVDPLRAYDEIAAALFARLQSLRAAGSADTFERLRGFLATRKGYRPDVVVVYFRGSREGGVAKLVL